MTADELGGLHHAIEAAEGSKVFTAAADIGVGEELSISYLARSELLQGVKFRRKRLAHWGFVCECDRCVEASNEQR